MPTLPNTGASPRGLLVSKAWIQAVAVVVLFGFFVLGLLAYLTYTGEAPIPGKVIAPDGRVLFTRADVIAGQEVFLRNGLMEYGSIFGHGAYLGPDYTADYLRRAALLVLKANGAGGSQAATVATIADFKTNRYNAATDTLQLSAAQAAAFRTLIGHYAAFFGEPTTRFGLRPQAITDPVAIRRLTAFFCWSAWVASAPRPGEPYSFPKNGGRIARRNGVFGASTWAWPGWSSPPSFPWGSCSCTSR
jgi:nitric oxide reductase subunit B